MLQLSMLEKNEFTHPFQGDFERLAVRKKEQELYNDEFYAKVTPDGTCIWSIFFVKRGVDPSYSLLIQRNKDIIRVHISRSSQDELPGRVVAKVFYPTVFSTDEEFDSNLLDGKTNEQLQHTAQSDRTRTRTL